MKHLLIATIAMVFSFGAIADYDYDYDNGYEVEDMVQSMSSDKKDDARKATARLKKKFDKLDDIEVLSMSGVRKVRQKLKVGGKHWVSGNGICIANNRFYSNVRVCTQYKRRNEDDEWVYADSPKWHDDWQCSSYGTQTISSPMSGTYNKCVLYYWKNKDGEIKTSKFKPDSDKLKGCAKTVPTQFNRKTTYTIDFYRRVNNDEWDATRYFLGTRTYAIKMCGSLPPVEAN